jgi:plasmid stabilization system protein ParE
LGGHFLDSVFSDIDSLSRNGGIHLKVFDYHRRLASRFPYAIYYRLDRHRDVVVYRVLDCRQDPAKTRIALKRSA